VRCDASVSCMHYNEQVQSDGMRPIALVVYVWVKQYIDCGLPASLCVTWFEGWKAGTVLLDALPAYSSVTSFNIRRSLSLFASAL